MAVKTTYTTSDGQKKTGYIQNGVTYTDASLKTRVPTGSVVATANGDYYKGTEKDYGVKLESAGMNDDSFNLYGKDYKTTYNQKGEAFVDRDATTRVPVGTTIRKNGSTYYNDAQYGMTPTISGVQNDYRNSTNNLNEYLTAAYNAEQKALDSRTKSRLNEIKERERQVEAEKTKADRESYNAYLQATNPYGALAQSQAKLGLSNSGFSESSLASLGSTYQQALAGNEESRAKAMLELKLRADQAISEGDREKYNLFASMYKTLVSNAMTAASKEADIGIAAAKMLNDRTTRYEDYEQEEKMLDKKSDREIVRDILNNMTKVGINDANNKTKVDINDANNKTKVDINDANNKTKVDINDANNKTKMDINDANNKTKVDINDANNKTNIDINDANNKTKVDINDANNKTNIDINDANNKNKIDINNANNANTASINAAKNEADSKNLQEENGYEIAQAIIKAISGGELTLEQIAKELGYSVSTLRTFLEKYLT